MKAIRNWLVLALLIVCFIIFCNQCSVTKSLNDRVDAITSKVDNANSVLSNYIESHKNFWDKFFK